jgi:importin subunit beta-1
MTLLLQLIQSAGKQSPILEDAFLSVGAVTAALEQDFHPYLQAFLPFLINALNSHEEYQLCSIAVGLIGDICRALGEASLPYCQGFMEVLLADLQSTVLHRSVKPPILSCFGDVALAVGPGFEPFLETTMGVLQQAGAMRADPVRSKTLAETSTQGWRPALSSSAPQSNFDLVDYINVLREGILEAYTGIIGGLKTGGKTDILLPYINSIFTFLHLTLTDQDRTEPILRAAIGLLGDLAEAFPNGQLKEALSTPWVGEMLKAGRTKLGGPETKKVAKWAKEVSCSTAATGKSCWLTRLSFFRFADGPPRYSVEVLFPPPRLVRLLRFFPAAPRSEPSF